MSSSAKRALVLFAPGFEEIETITILDVLRRAGLEVVAAGTESGPLRGAHGVLVAPDRTMAGLSARDFDAVILPGGSKNAQTLASHAEAQRILREARDSDRAIGAICAAPLALRTAGLLEGRRYTSHPSIQKDLPAAGYRTERVVVDGNLLTSRGPGTALEFSLALVEHLLGARKAEEVKAPMLAPPMPVH